MAKTVFHNIKFRNFLAVGNAGMEYQFDKNNHTLITGKNGDGKSSMMDALTYVLFNKPFRDCNLPLLINSINGKEMVVEIEFTTNNIPYKVIRGMKPNIFEIWCNGELMNQESKNRDYQKILENQILKMNYKTFTQVVIIGAANFTVFMKLASNARREIVDDFLDTKILSDMNKLLKVKMNDTKNALSSVNSELAIKAESIKIKEGYVARMESARTGKLASLEEDIKKLETEESMLLEEIKTFEDEIEVIASETEKIDSIQETVTKLNIFEKRFKSNIKSYNDKIKYYQEITHCPQCEQDICDEHKSLMIRNNKENLETQETGLKEICDKIEPVKQKLESIKLKQKEFSTKAKLLTAKNAELKMVSINKDKLIKEKSALEKSSENLDEEIKSLKSVASEAMVLVERKKALTHEKSIQETATQLLKDQGIKTSIVRKYLPTLNSLINKYCAELDFFVLFEFDENFVETIKSRHRDKFAYGSFSEGQKKRIDFAIVFAWRELIRQKNSIDTNLLILDEVFDGSLDAEGVELFKNIIFGDMLKNYNVFLISHWPDWGDTFPNNLHVELNNNFSVFKEKD